MLFNLCLVDCCVPDRGWFTHSNSSFKAGRALVRKGSRRTSKAGNMISLDRGKVFIGLLFLLRVLPVWSTSRELLSLTQSFNLMAGDTLKSVPKGYFELGIFPFSQKYYLCIRYRPPIGQAVTWVANRDTPLVSSDSYLRLSSPDGILQLFDPATHPTKPLWSALSPNTGAVGTVAELLDNGNLVLKDNKSASIWESFNDTLSLTDTLLPGQHLYRNDNISLTSWITKDDPAPGPYHFGWGTRGNLSNILQLAWTAPKTLMIDWAGGAYVPAPLLDEQSPHIVPNVSHVFVDNEKGHLTHPSSSPNITPADQAFLKGGDALNSAETVLKRITIDMDGGLRIWQWKVGTSKTWTAVANWVVTDRPNLGQCTAFATCGQFGRCKSLADSLDRVQCECPQGFKPIYNNDVARGCIHAVPVLNKPDCNDAKKVWLLELSGDDMPWAGGYKNFTTDDPTKCRDECLKDCDCAGATYGPHANATIKYCRTKKAPLYNLGYPTTIIHSVERRVFIKVPILPKSDSSGNRKKLAKLGMIIGPAVVGGVLVGLVLFCLYRRRDSLRGIFGGPRTSPDDRIPDFTGPTAAPPETLEGSNREQRDMRKS